MAAESKMDVDIPTAGRKRRVMEAGTKWPMVGSNEMGEGLSEHTSSSSTHEAKFMMTFTDVMELMSDESHANIQAMLMSLDLPEDVRTDAMFASQEAQASVKAEVDKIETRMRAYTMRVNAPRVDHTLGAPPPNRRVQVMEAFGELANLVQSGIDLLGKIDQEQRLGVQLLAELTASYPSPPPPTVTITGLPTPSSQTNALTDPTPIADDAVLV